MPSERTIDFYYYQGIHYTWHHEPQNEYSSRHICLSDAVYVISSDDSYLEVQDEYDPQRFKYIGVSGTGIITVITDESNARIITAWHASATEIKLWLKDQYMDINYEVSKLSHRNKGALGQ